MCVKCWWSGRPVLVAPYRVLRTKYSAILGLFSNTTNNGHRAGRGRVSNRLSCEDARNIASSERSYAERYSWTAWPNETCPAKNGIRQFAVIAPLRSANEIPSPANGSTNPAASPASRIPSFSGCGSRKISGEVLTGSISNFQLQLRLRNASCCSNTSSNVLAT